MASDKAAPLLKDLMGADAMRCIAAAASVACPQFDAPGFLRAALDGLETLSVMARVARAADCLHAGLPDDHRQALAAVLAMAPMLPAGFVSMVLPEWVGRHGRGDYQASMAALKVLTRYGTAEFAIRSFLVADLDTTLTLALTWAADGDEHVRRLASEGTRPRLPWARHVEALTADPELTRPILDALRADPSAYVRRSVANHLADVAKRHPDWVLDLVEAWPREVAETRWIVTHALRNLVKAGNPRALSLLGASAGANVVLRSFSLGPSELTLGQKLLLEATLVSTTSQSQRLVVDYAIHYVKKNGVTGRKVFKLRTLDLAGRSEVHLSKRQLFADFTTRKHYAGTHEVELLVNGESMAKGRFSLTL